MGSLYGAMLHKAGCKVDALCGSDYCEVREHGVRVDSVWGKLDFHPGFVAGSPNELNDDYDLILVATKVVPGAKPWIRLKNLFRPGCTLLLIQNGLRNELPWEQNFPQINIVSCVAFVCAFRTEPGKVRHLDYGKLAMGNWPIGKPGQAEAVAGLLEKAGVPCALTENITHDRWVKLLWNAAFNPISVLGGIADTQQILGETKMRELVVDIMREVLAIAKADGCPVAESNIEQRIQHTEKMKPYRTSMLLDYEAKRPLEINAILSTALQIADEHGVPCPKMKTLEALLILTDKLNR